MSGRVCGQMQWKTKEVLKIEFFILLLWKESLLEGSTYHVPRMPCASFLCASCYLPGRVLGGSSEVQDRVSGTAPCILLSPQKCSLSAFLSLSSSLLTLGW